MFIYINSYKNQNNYSVNEKKSGDFCFSASTSIIYSIFAKKKVIMKYTDKDIQQAIELSQYAANKCSELEDYSIEMEEQLFRLQRKCSLIRTLQITTPISLLIGLC